MNFIRTHIISKIITALFALHILNISVDAPDRYPDWVKEDLSINDMESISEIICEKILHINNAFPEFDDHDNNDRGAVLMNHLDLIFHSPVVIAILPYTYTNFLYAKHIEDLFAQYIQNIVSPPPEPIASFPIC